MATFLYVDNSNVWIEGMRVSACKLGMAQNIWTAIQENISDSNWKMDFGKLFRFAGGDNSDVKKAVLFGSRPPRNDSLWEAAKRIGFEVITYDRNSANSEKKIDTDLVATMFEDSYELLQSGDEITIVAGDSDYVPAILKLKRRNIPVHVVFWKHASQELKQEATTFTELDKWIDYISKK